MLPLPVCFITDVNVGSSCWLQYMIALPVRKYCFSWNVSLSFRSSWWEGTCLTYHASVRPSCTALAQVWQLASCTSWWPQESRDQHTWLWEPMGVWPWDIGEYTYIRTDIHKGQNHVQILLVKHSELCVIWDRTERKGLADLLGTVKGTYGSCG